MVCYNTGWSHSCWADTHLYTYPPPLHLPTSFTPSYSVFWNLELLPEPGGSLTWHCVTVFYQLHACNLIQIKIFHLLVHILEMWINSQGFHAKADLGNYKKRVRLSIGNNLHDRIQPLLSTLLLLYMTSCPNWVCFKHKIKTGKFSSAAWRILEGLCLVGSVCQTVHSVLSGWLLFCFWDCFFFACLFSFFVSLLVF